MSDAFPPYCGAERIRIFCIVEGARAQFRPQPDTDVSARLAAMAKVGTIEVEIDAICTRACHPLTEQHVDVERSISWPEPGNYVRDPFTPSGT